MAATSENKSMMIVWVVAAVLVILGIFLAIPGTPEKKSMTGAAPEPAEKIMSKEEAKPMPKEKSQ